MVRVPEGDEALDVDPARSAVGGLPLRLDDIDAEQEVGGVRLGAEAVVRLGVEAAVVALDHCGEAGDHLAGERAGAPVGRGRQGAGRRAGLEVVRGERGPGDQRRGLDLVRLGGEGGGSGAEDDEGAGGGESEAQPLPERRHGGTLAGYGDPWVTSRRTGGEDSCPVSQIRTPTPRPRHAPGGVGEAAKTPSLRARRRLAMHAPGPRTWGTDPADRTLGAWTSPR